MARITLDLKSALWAIVIDFGQDLGKTLLPELWPAIQEFLKQRLTPDGWTKHEWGTYLLGVISRVRRAQLGNAVTDKGADWLLDALYDLVEDALEEDEEAPPAGDPVDYSNVPLEKLLDTIPDPKEYPDGIKLWRYEGTKKYILTTSEADRVGRSGILVAVTEGGAWKYANEVPA